MSSSITLSAATRQNLLSLQDTASLLSTTQSRLSTGKKVNSALDNPTNFFTAQSLSARSSDLSGLLDGISNGIQAIQSANQGITSIQKLIDTAKSTAKQALADKTGGSSGVTGGAQAQSAKVTGSATLAALGSTDASGKVTFDLSSPSKDASLDISLDGGLTKTTLRLDSTTLASSGTNLSKVSTDQLITAINGQIANNATLAGKLTAGTSPDGRITFSSSSTGSTAQIKVAGSANATVDVGYGKSTTPPQAATVTAKAALAATTDFSTGSASLVVSDGNISVQVKIDKNSATDKLGGTLGTSGTQANVVAAINKQLKDNGSTATVALGSGADANKLVFSSADVGPDSQISVIGGIDTTGGNGAAGIGFSTFTASAPVAGAAAASTLTLSASTYVAPVTAQGTAGTAVVVAGATGVAGTTTSSVTSGANIDFTGGKSATFVVGDGTKTASVTLDTQSFNGAASPGNPTRSEFLSALNSQLSGINATASFVNNKLTFTNTATGSGKDATVSASYDTVGLGFQTGGTDTLQGTIAATTTLSTGQSSSFTVSDGSKTTSIKLDATSLDAGGTAIGNSVTQSKLLEAINRQLKADNNQTTASIAGNKLVLTSNAVGTTQAAPAVTQGTDAIGLFGAPSTTKSSATGTFPANLDFSKGQSAAFTVDGTAVTLNSASLDKSGTALGNNPIQSKVLESINQQLAAGSGTANVTAYLDTAGKLSFARQGTAAGAVAAPVVTAVSDTTSGLGFGTANTLTATNTATTPSVSTAAVVTAGGASAATTLTLSSTANTFSVGDGTKTANISISSTSLDKSGTALGASATQAKVAEAIQVQLDAAGVNATAAYANNKLTFTSKGVGSSGTVTLTPGSDSAGLSTGAAGSSNLPQTATGIPAGSLDLSNGKSSVFSISDGTNSKNVSISATSLDKSGNAIGSAATEAKVAEAIQAQLDTGGVKATVAFVGDKLQLTSNAVGTAAAAPTLTATSDTAGLGLGTTTTTSSASAAGTGTAAVGISSSGTEATDGSSRASLVGTERPATADFSGTKDASFTLKLGSGATKMITLNNANVGSSTTTSQTAIAKAINDQIAADTGLAGNVQASFVNNKLVISTTASGSDQKLTIQASQLTSGGSAGVDIGFGVSGSGATSLTSSGTDVGGSKGASSVRSSLAAQYNEVLQQISQQAQDAGYNGINLLFRSSNNAADNTLHIAFNEKNTSALDIAGAKFDASGLGLASVNGGFQSDADVNTAIDQLNAATTTLRTQSSTFGANLSVVQNRQDFTKSLTTILDTGAANLTNADLNEEAANSQALSTRNSLAISALSLANQAQQGILQLLR